jgi:hypothetical protein
LRKSPQDDASVQESRGYGHGARRPVGPDHDVAVERASVVERHADELTGVVVPAGAYPSGHGLGAGIERNVA